MTLRRACRRSACSVACPRRGPHRPNLDRSITTHPHDRAIVRSIIALTCEIGLEVTADGVETGAQADALIALGCVRQQGHLYAPALPEDGFENYLLRRLAEQYVQAADTRPTWNTHELT
ncbi:MAG: EAL domain-containing protein [Ilumatobacteraceae bacterium]